MTTTPDDYARKLVDNVSTALQIPDDDLEHVEDWKRNAKILFAMAVQQGQLEERAQWVSVKDGLPEPGVECLVYGPRGIGSEGGPYLGVAVLRIDSRTWMSLRYFEARDDLGALKSVGHRPIDVSREWNGVQVSHWVPIHAPDPSRVKHSSLATQQEQETQDTRAWPQVDPHMSDEDLTVAAARIKDSIDWTKFPKLAGIFEYRPPINRYWHELVALTLTSLEVNGALLNKKIVAARVEAEIPKELQPIVQKLQKKITVAHDDDGAATIEKVNAVLGQLGLAFEMGVGADGDQSYTLVLVPASGDERR